MRRPGSGTASASLDDRVDRLLPAVAQPDVESGRIQAHVTAHDAGELDVAHLVVDDVGPVDPRLLHGDRLQPEVGRHARDLARVVGLDTSDRHQRVAPAGQRLRYEVLEPRLVAPEGDPRVAVLALGPDLDPATEARAQAGQGVNRRRAEREQVALEVVELIGRPSPYGDSGRPVPIIESRVTSAARSSSDQPSVPSGRMGSTR